MDVWYNNKIGKLYLLLLLHNYSTEIWNWSSPTDTTTMKEKLDSTVHNVCHSHSHTQYFYGKLVSVGATNSILQMLQSLNGEINERFLVEIVQTCLNFLTSSYVIQLGGSNKNSNFNFHIFPINRPFSYINFPYYLNEYLAKIYRLGSSPNFASKTKEFNRIS